MKHAIICDLDMTLLKPCMPEGYIHSSENFKNNEMYYYAHLEKCKPIPHVWNLVDNWMKNNPEDVLIFLTARKEPFKGIDTRSKTMQSLQYFTKYNMELHMCPEGLICKDEQEVADYKLFILNKLKQNYKILFAFDDNESNKQMYLHNGVPAFTPNELTDNATITIEGII